jgi:fructose-1,6-bisphosphatase/inositol monophosphatase family enzyme
MSLSETQQKQLLSFANDLADVARVLLQQAVSIKPKVEVKNDLTFVTQTDKEVELELRNMIESHVLNGPWVGRRILLLGTS